MSSPPSADEPSLRERHQFSDDEWFAYASRVATPPTDDEHNVFVGMDRPATPDELRAFVDRENARIARERGLPPTS